MNTVIPILIVLSLGAGSGLILRRWLKNIWLTSLAAGLAGTIMWGLIMEVLFLLADFNEERGATHYEGILIVFLVTSVASFTAIKLKSMKKNMNI